MEVLLRLLHRHRILKHSIWAILLAREFLVPVGPFSIQEVAKLALNEPEQNPCHWEVYRVGADTLPPQCLPFSVAFLPILDFRMV